MARQAPTHAELERAITSVPGVAEAHVSLVEETGKSRLRIRLTNDDEAEAVSWAIAATLRERFGISLDPEQIRPRTLGSQISGTEVEAGEAGASSAGRPAASEPSQAEEAPLSGKGEPPQPEPPQPEPALAEDEPSQPEPSPAEPEPSSADEVSVSGDRVLLSEAARALFDQALEEAEAEAREGAQPSDAGSQPTEEDARPANVPTADHVQPSEEEAQPADVPAADHGQPTPEPIVPVPDVTAEADLDVALDIEPPVVDSDRSATPMTEVEPASDDRATETSPQQPGERRSRSSGQVTPLRDDLARARIHHLDTRVDVSDVRVIATLAYGGRTATSEVRSVPTQLGVLRAVAEATVGALRQLTGERLVAGVDSVAASVSGDPPIATVVVSILTDRGDEALLGSSLVRKDPERAVMRATLDALNRRVEPWLEVDIAG